MRTYHCNNSRLENFLWENGISPIREDSDGMVVYKWTPHFQSLLDLYFIKY